MRFLLPALCYILSPLFIVIVILPLYGYRYVVIILARFFLPEGSEIIDPLSVIFSSSQYCTSPVQTIVAYLTFRGRLDESVLFRIWGNAAKKYRKLRSLPVQFGFFTFWSPFPEERFSISNHIKELGIIDGKLTTEDPPSFTSYEEFLKIKEIVLTEPFQCGQSPWMNYIVRNVQHSLYEDEGPVDQLIIKWDHGLADGLSIIKILQCSGKEEKLFSFPAVSKRIPKSLDIALSIQSIFCLLENVFKKSKEIPSSPVSLPVERLDGKSTFTGESNWITVASIKSIKNGRNVAFITVLLAALRHACREFVSKKGVKMPEVVNSFVPFPYSGHPDDKLVNHWSGVLIPLPVGEENEEKNLQLIQQHIKRGKNQAIQLYKKMSLVLRVPFLLAWSTIPPFPILYTDIAGPEGLVNVSGSECIDMGFSSTLPPRSFGIFASSLSYNGKWKFEVRMDAGLVENQEEADEFANSVTRYIALLDKSDTN